jgi:hypothetical protein
MLRALQGQANPKHRSAFVITVSGYFGDGDEYFNIEESSVGGYRGSEELVERTYHAYMYLKDNWVEDKGQLPEEHREYIRGASWDDEVLPSRDLEISLTYYDHLGYANDVEVSPEVK